MLCVSDGETLHHAGGVRGHAVSRHQSEYAHVHTPACTSTLLTPLCCVQVRVAALQNLVKIMSLYYQYMETYMGPALFAVRMGVFGGVRWRAVRPDLSLCRSPSRR